MQIEIEIVRLRSFTEEEINAVLCIDSSKSLTPKQKGFVWNLFNKKFHQSKAEFLDKQLLKDRRIRSKYERAYILLMWSIAYYKMPLEGLINEINGASCFGHVVNCLRSEMVLIKLKGGQS